MSNMTELQRYHRTAVAMLVVGGLVGIVILLLY